MKDDVIELCLARMVDSTAATNRLAHIVERLVDVVGSYDGKTETRELAYKTDLLTVRRESTDAILGFTKALLEFKAALDLKEKQDPSWLTALKLFFNGPLVKFVLVLIVFTLGTMLAIANGLIKLK